MPKKAVNTKSLEARERKQATKTAAKEKAVREAEDALWQDDDKNSAKKKQRKEEEERKKAEALKKKAENKALLEQELASIKPTTKQSIQKISQAEVRIEIEKRNKAIEALATPKQESRIVRDAMPLEENLNRVMADTTVASSVDEAIAVLSLKDEEGDKHPEKRMRAAYKAFEAENLPRIKADNPSMRLSQWKQLLQREWNKSPQNPLNAAKV